MISTTTNSLATSQELAAALRWGLSDADWARLEQRVGPLRAAVRPARGQKARQTADDDRPGPSSAEHWIDNPGRPLTCRDAAAELLAWTTLATATDHAANSAANTAASSTTDGPLNARTRAALLERLAGWLADRQGDAPAHRGGPAHRIAAAHEEPLASADPPALDPVAEFWWTVELPLVHCLLERAVLEPTVGEPRASGQMGIDRGERATRADKAVRAEQAARAELADRSAAAALERSWPSWMDAEGVPHASILSDIWLLLASWTRCLSHRERLALGPWSDNLTEQYDRFMQQLCRLARTDGTALFPERAASQPSRELLAAALAWVPHEETRATARFAGLISGSSPAGAAVGKAAVGKAAVELPGMPLLPCYAEGTGLAVMRSDWTTSALQVATAFDNDRAYCSIAAGRHAWISGEWQARLAINGRPLAVTAPWREILWFSDDEVDYWEWELYLEDDWRLQRQVLLYRNAKWCLLADAVLGEEPASIDYHGAWRLAENAAFQPATDSHEGRLEASQARAVVLPLALPEWRAEASPGTLAAADGQLELRLRRQGQALFAPLFVLADRQLTRQPFTWRRLTVAESLRIVSVDMAAGYRVQFGRKHWTFYRALGAEANRTLLGQNVSSNFLACEFQPDGLARPLVRIEASNGGRIGPDAAPRADHR